MQVKHVNRARPDFSKADRLLTRNEFQRVKQKGRNRHTAHFIVSLAKNDLGWPRLGVVVTKRLGKAVRRNRVKRLLREFFRLHKGVLPLQDIVIIAKKGAADLNYTKVQAELGAVLLLSGDNDGAGG